MDLSILNISLIDIKGKDLFSGNLDSFKSLNIQDLENGLYIIKIITNEKSTLYTKFIKE